MNSSHEVSGPRCRTIAFAIHEQPADYFWSTSRIVLFLISFSLVIWWVSPGHSAVTLAHSVLISSASYPVETATPTEPSMGCECRYAAHIIFDCTGGWMSDRQGMMKLAFIPGSLKHDLCEPIVCDESFFDCVLECRLLDDQQDESCRGLVQSLVSQVTHCVEKKSGGIFCWKRDEKDPAGVFIESSEPFYCCLCTWEAGVPCDATHGLPIGNCPIYNLCDAIPGNETSDWGEFKSGIGIECFPAVCPDVFPTWTPASTSTPIPTSTTTSAPTFTFTSIPTSTKTLAPSHTPTSTQTKLPSPTQTPLPSATPTPTQQDCVCEYAVRITFDCAGEIMAGTDNLRLSFIPGIRQVDNCDPVNCEDSWVQCYLSCMPPRIRSADWCSVITLSLAEQLAACLEKQAGVLLCWKLDEKDPRSVIIQASEPFYCCLCTDEAGVPCAENIGIPLDKCPVYNLCDGTVGNETNSWEEFHSGIGIECAPLLCPDVILAEPTPTPTRRFRGDPGDGSGEEPSGIHSWSLFQ